MEPVEWAPERIRLGGLIGFIGCGLFSAFLVIATVLGLSHIEQFEDVSGLLASVVTWLHVIAYLLMVVLLSIVWARYGSELGRIGRGVVALEGLAILGGATGLIISVLIAPNWLPGQIYVGISFLAMHVLGTVLGVVLWTTTAASRLAAALLSLTILMIVPAIVFELPAAVIEAPLALGFTALGYEFWTYQGGTMHSVGAMSGG